MLSGFKKAYAVMEIKGKSFDIATISTVPGMRRPRRGEGILDGPLLGVQLASGAGVLPDPTPPLPNSLSQFCSFFSMFLCLVHCP